MGRGSETSNRRQTTAEPTDALGRLSEPEVRSNPYPFLGWLRENDPVHRTRAGFYLVTRHADVLWVLQNTGSVFRVPSSENPDTEYPEARRHQSKAIFLNSFAMKDPPEHTRLRRLVARDFSPQRVERLRPRIGDICDRTLDAITAPLRDGEVVDLHRIFSMRLSTNITAALFGVPEDRCEWLAGMAADSVAATMTLSRDMVDRPEEMLARANESSGQITEYFRDLFAARRRSPEDDLISAMLAKHRNDPGQLTDDELLGTLWVLWIAGVENVAGAIDQGVRSMLNQPGECRWLRGDLTQATAFAEETVRCDASSLFAGIMRIATRDVELSGTVIPAGSDVRPSMAAANHDPSVFSDPDRFDPARDHKAALSFGHGMRRSPGKFLSLAAMTVSLPKIHARFPDLVAAGEPVWHDQVSTRYLRALPVSIRGKA